MAIKTHVRGQLLGYKELPSESGLWGVLLPRPGEKAVAHEPDAQDVIAQIDADRLVFGNSERVGNRGFLFAFCLPLALVQLVAVPKFAGAINLADLFDAVFVVFWLSLMVVPAITAYRSARAPLPSPILISRKLRKVYAWMENSKRWMALDYDKLTPATFVHRAVTTAGSATVYVLTLCQLKPGTREIEYSVVPAPARGHPEFCGAMWEFIRRYMDGKPEALPPVRLVPKLDHPKAWMARTDRTVFTDMIDPQHRIKRQFFAMAVVWFWGSVGYWWDRAAGWIERTAPHRPLPDELQAISVQDADNPYRIAPPSDIERQAQAGTLPYMRRRWLICGVVGTLVWGTLFGLAGARIWLLR